MKPKPPDPEILAWVEEQNFARSQEWNAKPLEERQAVSRQMREAREREVERLNSDWKDMLESWIATAVKRTGLSREELLRRAEICPDRQSVDPAGIKPPNGTACDLARDRGVPPLHLRNIADRTPIDCDALKCVREFIAADQQLFLVLAGPVGLRKSGSACWALTQTKGLYVSALSIADLASKPENRDKWARARRAPLLVLDELSIEYTDDKGFFYKAFNQLIQERYVGLLKTIITYNGNAQSFRDTYGERAYSRTKEEGLFIELDGPDVRLQQHWSDTERSL